jgi:hypothetical protein
MKEALIALCDDDVGLVSQIAYEVKNAPSEDDMIIAVKGLIGHWS